MTREEQRGAALDAIAAILEGSADADDVLRETVDVLAGLYEGVALVFVEDGGIVAGPSRGRPEGGLTVPVRFDGAEVGRLTVAPVDGDEAFLERVAALIAPYCLVGWDTGGEPWEP